MRAPSELREEWQEGLDRPVCMQNLVAPVHIVLNAFQSIAVPRASREYATGGRKAMLAFLIPTAARAGVVRGGWAVWSVTTAAASATPP